MKWYVSLVIILFSLCSHTVSAQQESPNAKQARRVFQRAYDMIYGPEGASFDYKISILKIYSSEGSGWYKGNKSKSTTLKSIIWDNGDIKYILKKDKLLQKFKFNPDDFNYHIASHDDGLLITLKAKPGVKGSMKHIEALLERGSFKPKKLSIKVAFFWAHIYFSNFKAGGIDDKLFIFPREKYPDYKIVDER